MVILVAPLVLSGCVGLSHNLKTKTEVCYEHCLIYREHTIENLKMHNRNTIESSVSELKSFLGTPDEINVLDEGVTEWTYYGSTWLGVVPIVLIPIPLMLPVGKEQVRFRFNGDSFHSFEDSYNPYEVNFCSLVPVLSDPYGFCVINN